MNLHGILFQSTHSLRSATLNVSEKARPLVVSIHALLAECDSTHRERSRDRIVSIHALLAECDDAGHIPVADGCGFNPRTPCGVRPGNIGFIFKRCGFNPRTPCGVRRSPVNNPCSWHVFQSTHSLRSATYFFHSGFQLFPVSIHALLAECDDAGHIPVADGCSFNPRTPCGVRPL